MRGDSHGLSISMLAPFNPPSSASCNDRYRIHSLGFFAPRLSPSPRNPRAPARILYSFDSSVPHGRSARPGGRCERSEMAFGSNARNFNRWIIAESELSWDRVWIMVPFDICAPIDDGSSATCANIVPKAPRCPTFAGSDREREREC